MKFYELPEHKKAQFLYQPQGLPGHETVREEVLQVADRYMRLASYRDHELRPGGLSDQE